tara:strand:- start:397 stop:600 length:204 start_codon:yes stop_codon:yes gene_type:complete
MTTTELYTTLENDLVDDQRAMDRMDADRDYDLALTYKKIKQMDSKPIAGVDFTQTLDNLNTLSIWGS